MDYINLGKTGLKVSRICLGCMTYGAAETSSAAGGHHAWTLNEEESRPFIKRAVDAGINFFDTANNYSSGESEGVLGRAFGQDPTDEAFHERRSCPKSIRA
jgi:aryl-alcohol dehydrogenase-like predicted oxidoreductase